jgi:hypothetical protein
VSDELKYVLPFRSRYSFYLYDLLRTYQNRNSWTFKLDELREALDVYERLANIDDYQKVYDGAGGNETQFQRNPLYPNFADFRRNVLDSAVDDINQFSNIKVVYRLIKNRRAVEAIEFIYEDKTDEEKLESSRRGRTILDRTFSLPGFVAPEDAKPPIEFVETHDTGEDTIPESITVMRTKVKKAQSVSEMAQCVQESLYAATQESGETDGSSEIAYLGKRKRHKKKASTIMPVETYFPIEKATAKRYMMQTDAEKVHELGQAVGGEFEEWCNSVSLKEFIQFFRYCIKELGSLRLQQYSVHPHMIFSTSNNQMTIEIGSKTTADHLRRFTSRVFGKKASCTEALEAYRNKQAQDPAYIYPYN